jgi:membrane peptidoglycan carboxypeptidase
MGPSGPLNERLFRAMRRHGSWPRVAAGAAVLAALSTVAFGIAAESKSFWLQSAVFSRLAGQLEFELGSGPSSSIRFPAAGPYDLRLGYTDLPRYIERLEAQGYRVDRQARLSPRHLATVERGAFPIYQERTQAGLALLDHRGAAMFEARFPQRIYPDFEAVPPLVVSTLLFIENRTLLDPASARRNPAIEWSRLLAVVPSALANLTDPTVSVPGASTLATQIEKYRHSPYGRTDDVGEKLRQMVSASLRAYRDGPDTSAARRQIVVDYLNSTPLAARAGFGEVNGVGDGLYAWFGSDFAAVNSVLRANPRTPETLAAKALYYKQVLSLLLAQRRPAYYLLAGRDDLEALADSYLRLLLAENIIDAALAQAALARRLQFPPAPPAGTDVPFVDHKAANAIRAELLNLLDVRSLYALDRLDLTGTTSIDLAAQQRLTAELQQLTDPAAARDLGLYGHRLLDPGDSGEPLIASLTLYERGDGVNYLRVQTDNLNQPFDLNSGAKLDLGSTAKLRTLITYLEIVAALHARLCGLDPAQRKALAASAADPLTRWAAEYLQSAADAGLTAMLEAAMARRYSASPWERFFTGGGVHRFANFDADDNGRVMSVAEAFRHSVNLVFIRLMRDIVQYYQAAGAPAEAILGDRQHPLRKEYLARFADREGTTFLNRFYDGFKGLSPDQVLDRLASQVRARAVPLAVIFRSLRPEADLAAFDAFLRARLATPPGERELARLYDGHGPDRLNLNDRAYLAGLHPLELWLASYWQDHPGTTRSAMLEAATAARQESYAWLFKTGSKAKQDKRIRILLEEEAFERIHEAWRRLGYPFDRLVPSYATAIGSSADRPEALAELVGILLNDGLWQPAVRVERLHFAADTPYETILAVAPPRAAQVLAPEIARLVRAAMIDVVETGTAVRLRGAFGNQGGIPLAIGAKTGTGDHRRKSFGPGGRLIDSQAVSRTATVLFFIGERLFGNITVYVGGDDAAGFQFTSSLPAQLLKGLAPAILPLLDGRDLRTAGAAAGDDDV